MSVRRRKLSAIDLFSGCGGLTYGLKAAGFNVIGAVEIDAAAGATYARNHKGVLLLRADIRAVDPNDWMKKLGVQRGELDLLSGCPPCQGFSVLRTKNGAKNNRDQRNTLLLEMVKFVEHFDPEAIMMENVPGIVNQPVYERFVRSVKDLGYKVDSRIDDVQNFGVPQRRKRLIFLASKGVAPKFGERCHQRITVRDVIGKLLPAGNSGDELHDFAEERSEATLRRISLIPADGGGRLDLPHSEQLKCHLKSDGFKDVYGRLKWDDVSPTITTGCYNPSKGRYLHPEENRCITMREAALLQSFPESFNVAPGTSKTQTAKMLGNALPPEFIRRHALAIKELIKAKRQTCA